MPPLIIDDEIEILIIEDRDGLMGRTTREPTEAEAKRIRRWLTTWKRREGRYPLGAFPVRGLGDVWVRLPRQ